MIIISDYFIAFPYFLSDQLVNSKIGNFLGIWVLLDRVSWAYRSFQGMCNSISKLWIVHVYQFVCMIVIWSSASLGLAGVYLQPEDDCQFPAFVAIYPRSFFLFDAGWPGSCGCYYRFVTAWCICLHLGIPTYWMGHSFCEFPNLVVLLSYYHIYLGWFESITGYQKIK